MVAQTIHLPNIRKLFKPDPGYMILDCDFDQADARVVAWDAGAPMLKEIFNDPLKDLHDENAKTIFGTEVVDEQGHVNKFKRGLAKRGVHATNYLITPNSLARSLGISNREANHFMDAWFTAHPEIPAWHSMLEEQLFRTRTVYNAFGYRKVYFDRIERVLSEAVAWIPQSTVAIAINKALYNIYRDIPEVQILIQVHDSLVMQVPIRNWKAYLPRIKQAMTIKIPYSDPLYLPTSAEASSISWGHKQSISWEGDFESPSQRMGAGF